MAEEITIQPEAVLKYLELVGEWLAYADTLPSDHQTTGMDFLNGIAANIGNKSDLSNQLQEAVYYLNSCVHDAYQLEKLDQS